MNKNMIWWFLIVIVVILALVFITINNKNKMPEEQITKAGDVVSMNYTGKLENGTVFDSNVDPKFGHVEPFTFKLGAGQVIPGWTEALKLMPVGSVWEVYIPSDLAYGDQGVPPTIGPNKTLVFKITLKDIKK